MGIETYALRLMQDEFPNAFIRTEAVFNHDYFDPTNRSTSDKIAIVEATPFLKTRPENINTGRQFFEARFKSTIMHYVSMGFTRIHLVFDNGSPASKYDTHAKRQRDVGSYPKTRQELLDASCVSDLDKWLSASKKAQTNSKLFAISTISDYSIVSDSAWDRYVSNVRVMNDMVAYMTHCFIVGRTNKKVKNQTTEDDYDHLRAGIYETVTNPFGGEPAKRLDIPEDVKIFIHLGKTYIKNRSGERQTIRDHEYIEITSDHYCRPEKIIKKNVLSRMKEGELTCAILCKYEMIRNLFKNKTKYEEFLLEKDASNSEKKFDPGCVVVDTVDGDLLPILLWTRILYEKSLKTNAYSDFLIKHIEGLTPHMLLWLRRSGEKAYRRPKNTKKNDKQNVLLNQKYAKEDDRIALDDREQSKQDWLKARSSKHTFTRSQFYDKREHEDDDDRTGASFLLSSFNKDARVLFNAQNNYERSVFSHEENGLFGDDGDGDSVFFAMMNGFQDTAKSTKSGIYRQRLYPTGTFVDIISFYDRITTEHPVFSKLESPVSFLTAILSLCNNDYIIKSLPGLTSSVDNRGQSLFYVALKENVEKHKKAFSFKFESVKYARAHPDVRYRVFCDYDTDDFKSYIMDVYYEKFLKPGRISDVLSKKVEKDFLQKYASEDRLKAICVKKMEKVHKKIDMGFATDREHRVRDVTDVSNCLQNLKKELSLNTLRTHLQTKANHMLNDDEMTGLFARLTWYLEYIVSSILNDGIYPDPLARSANDVSMFGWTRTHGRKGETEDDDSTHGHGELVYDKNYVISKTNHVASREKLRNEVWYNVSPQKLHCGPKSENPFKNILSENDGDDHASPEHRERMLNDILGISIKNGNEAKKIRDSDMDIRSDDDNDDDELKSEEFEKILHGERIFKSNIPTFDSIFNIKKNSEAIAQTIKNKKTIENGDEKVDTTDIVSTIETDRASLEPKKDPNPRNEKQQQQRSNDFKTQHAKRVDPITSHRQENRTRDDNESEHVRNNITPKTPAIKSPQPSSLQKSTQLSRTSTESNKNKARHIGLNLSKKNETPTKRIASDTSNKRKRQEEEEENSPSSDKNNRYLTNDKKRSKK